jgi:V/A-type H+-transporting ATPase subunit I
MFTPEPMSKVIIVAQKDRMAGIIEEVYRKHIFHIESFVEEEEDVTEGCKIGMPLPSANQASKDLLKLRSMINAFSIPKEGTEVEAKEAPARLRQLIEGELPALEKEVEGLLSEKTRLETRKKELEQKAENLKPFADVPFDLTLLRGFETMAVFSGFYRKLVVLNVPHEAYYSPKKGEQFLILVVPKEFRQDAERALLDAEFRPVPIPEAKGLPGEEIESSKKAVAEIAVQEEEIGKKLEDLKKKHTGFLLACNELLTSEVERAEAPLRFATTDQAFIAEGWIPRSKVPEFKEAVESASEGKAFVADLPVDPEHDKVPVEYDNLDFAKPSQMLMDLYSRPKYTEIDPTFMISIVFPIFFGIILGDVAYGAMLLALCLILGRMLKGDEPKMLLTTLRNASISSIVFGLLYSEFLGFALPWPPILFSRHLNIGAHAVGHGPAIPELMMMAIWIGIAHITLGRALGMINHARQDHGSHRTKAVMANLGWILLMWGILAMIWSAFPLPLMPDFSKLPVVVLGVNAATLAGAIMVLLGIIFIVRDAPLELVELPSIISHTLSYARMVAVGLSSVAIAMVINFIAIGMLIEPQLENLTVLGVVFIVGGVFVFLVGHVLNMVLGLLGGALHSIRLNYVEFFTKFYKGGGIKYNPFGMKKRFTED